MAPPRIEFREVRKVFRLRNRSDSLRDALPRLGARLLGRKPPPVPLFTALDGVSFNVESGEALGIIGPNGAGKSTALRLAAGVYDADAGTVAVRGRVSAMIELRAGFHPDLSGRENVYLAGALQGLRKSEVDSQFDRIVEFAQIGEFLDSPFRVYSSGMAVRLGFAVAAHVPAEVMLIDEVLAVGDLDFRTKCLRKMAERREEGVSILFVAHNLTIIEQFCDRVLFIHRGKVVAGGSPRSTIDTYRRHVSAESAVMGGGQSSAPRMRRGTGDLRLENVVVDGGNDGAPGEVPSDGTLRIRADWIVDSPQRRAVIGVAIHTIEGALCTEAACLPGEQGPEVFEGRGRMVLEFPRVGLLPGNYEVTVFATDESRLLHLDFHQGLYPLRVTGDHPKGEDGILSLHPRWTVDRTGNGS